MDLDDNQHSQANQDSREAQEIPFLSDNGHDGDNAREEKKSLDSPESIQSEEPLQDTGAQDFSSTDYAQLFPKKRGRKKKIHIEESFQENATDDAKTSDIGHNASVSASELQARAIGEKIAMMGSGIVFSIVPDYAPNTPEEKTLHEGAVKQTGQYFVDKKVPDLPPGWALAFAWGSYFTAVSLAERNRKKIPTLFDKIKAWWKFRKFRKND